MMIDEFQAFRKNNHMKLLEEKNPDVFIGVRK
jgi:hypothetical protein